MTLTTTKWTLPLFCTFPFSNESLQVIGNALIERDLLRVRKLIPKCLQIGRAPKKVHGAGPFLGFPPGLLLSRDLPWKGMHVNVAWQNKCSQR